LTSVTGRRGRRPADQGVRPLLCAEPDSRRVL